MSRIDGEQFHYYFENKYLKYDLKIYKLRSVFGSEYGLPFLPFYY